MSKRIAIALTLAALLAACEPQQERTRSAVAAEVPASPEIVQRQAASVRVSELRDHVYDSSSFGGAEAVSATMVGPDEACPDVGPCLRARELSDGGWALLLDTGRSLLIWQENHEDDHTVSRFTKGIGGAEIVREHGGLARVMLTDAGAFALVPKAATEEDVATAGYEVVLLSIGNHNDARVSALSGDLSQEPLNTLLLKVRQESDRLMGQQRDRVKKVRALVETCASAAIRTGNVQCKTQLGGPLSPQLGKCSLTSVVADMQGVCPVRVELENGWISLPAKNAFELSNSWQTSISNALTDPLVARDWEGTAVEVRPNTDPGVILEPPNKTLAPPTAPN